MKTLKQLMEDIALGKSIAIKQAWKNVKHLPDGHRTKESIRLSAKTAGIELD